MSNPEGYKIKINGRNYTHPNQFITGSEVKVTDNQPAKHTVFLKVSGHDPDKKIADNEQVDLEQQGVHYFYTAFSQYLHIIPTPMKYSDIDKNRIIILKEEWDIYKDKNKHVPFLFSCIKIAEQVMKLLDEDSTPLHNGYYPDIHTPHGIICRARDEVQGGHMRGFMVGCIASMIIKFHIRGIEFYNVCEKLYERKIVITLIDLTHVSERIKNWQLEESEIREEIKFFYENYNKNLKTEQNIVIQYKNEHKEIINYLKSEYLEGKRKFIISFPYEESEHFIIHPDGKDGKTLDVHL